MHGVQEQTTDAVEEPGPSPEPREAGASLPPQSWPVRALIGAVCGLAWACALRAYMEQLAGTLSSFDWWGTFFAILMPGALVGASLAAATGAAAAHRRALRWAAASPLLLAGFVLMLPGALVSLLTTGMGGGAIAVPLIGIAGGYALAGRRRALRVVLGVVALASLGAIVWTVPTVGDLPLKTPQGAWTATMVASLLVVLMLAASIPFARLRRLPPRAPRGPAPATPGTPAARS